VDRAQRLPREAGLPALAVLVATPSIFQDTPRASVALATLLGVATGGMFAAVSAGKALIYLAMLVATEALVSLRGRRESQRWLRRPQALQRWQVREQPRSAGPLRDQ